MIPIHSWSGPLFIIHGIHEPCEAASAVAFLHEAMDIIGGLTRWYSIRSSKLPGSQWKWGWFVEHIWTYMNHHYWSQYYQYQLLVTSITINHINHHEVDLWSASLFMSINVNHNQSLSMVLITMNHYQSVFHHVWIAYEHIWTSMNCGWFRNPIKH